LKEGQSCNAVHPGVIGTNLMRNLPWIARKGMRWLRPIYFKTIPQGAATQVFVATHSAVDGITGEYFSDSGLTKPSRKGRDVEMAEKLWGVTEEWVAQFRTHDGKGGGA
jgi:WW domain-containing oxidoreductase